MTQFSWRQETTDDVMHYRRPMYTRGQCRHHRWSVARVVLFNVLDHAGMMNNLASGSIPVCHMGSTGNVDWLMSNLQQLSHHKVLVRSLSRSVIVTHASEEGCTASQSL